MGIRLLSGRLLDDRDDQNIRGRLIDRNPWVAIVGVVADEKQDGLDNPAQPQVYSSIAQAMSNPMTFVVRSTSSPESALAAALIKALLFGVDPLDLRTYAGALGALALIATVACALPARRELASIRFAPCGMRSDGRVCENHTHLRSHHDAQTPSRCRRPIRH